MLCSLLNGPNAVLVFFTVYTMYGSTATVIRSSRNQTGLDKTLTPQRNYLLLLNISLIYTTAISLIPCP